LRWVAASHYLSSPQARARALGAVLQEVSRGLFSPRIAGRFPLRQAAQAHIRLASRTVEGKLLLQA
jgi:NADPH:quinone reductase-like Zn-dependent oxidoreductase